MPLGTAALQTMLDAYFGITGTPPATIWFGLSQTIPSNTPQASGTATGTTASTLTDATASWVVNRFVGATVFAGSSSGVVRSNTTTALTVGSWVGGTPAGTAAYSISSYQEPVGNAYGRPSLTNDNTNFPPASAADPSNKTTAQITFPTATGAVGAWGTAVALIALDAVAGGNLLFWQTLSVPQTINGGQTPTFAAGSVVLSAT